MNESPRTTPGSDLTDQPPLDRQLPPAPERPLGPTPLEDGGPGPAKREGRIAEFLDDLSGKGRSAGRSLPGGERISGMADSVGDYFSHTAAYLRERGASSLEADVLRTVQHSPKASVALAAGLGFVLGLALRR